MRVDQPARPLAWTRYLLLVMVAGLLAAAGACGNAATPGQTSAPEDVATPVKTSTLGATTATVPALTSSPTPPVTKGPVTGAVVRVAGVDFPVQLAVESEDRIQGLSGRASLDAGTGMLFVFEEENRLVFWMKEMEFPLDMVWIGAGCRVVDISENVPAPDPETPLSDLPRYSPDTPALYVLEINGGESAARGFGPGDPVEFVGALAGEYGC